MAYEFNQNNYDPRKDPLIQRARRRGPKRYIWLVLLVGFLVYYFFFDQGRFSLDRLSGGDAPQPTQKLGATPTLTSGTPVPAAQTPQEQGPYCFRWTPGQRLYYGISCSMNGKGTPELDGDNGLAVGFDADFFTTTKNVNPDGGADVNLIFGDLNMYGNHFGTQIDLRRRQGVTVSAAPENINPPLTAAAKKFKPPDITSFDNPIDATFTPNGMATNVESADGFNRFFRTIVWLSTTRFPQSHLQIGDTWESEFDVPIPSLRTSVPVHMTSTLANVTQYQGKNCAQILQTIAPSEKGRSGVRGVVDKATGGMLPKMAIYGEVATYFSLDYGKIVHAESVLNFDVELKGGFKAIVDLLGTYTGMLDELEGGSSYDLNPPEGEEEQEPPGIRVETVLTLK